MDERQLVCYSRSGTCSLRGSVCCVLLIFSPFKYPLQIPHEQPKLKVLLPLNRIFLQRYTSWANLPAFQKSLLLQQIQAEYARNSQIMLTVAVYLVI